LDLAASCSCPSQRSARRWCTSKTLLTEAKPAPQQAPCIGCRSCCWSAYSYCPLAACHTRQSLHTASCSRLSRRAALRHLPLATLLDPPVPPPQLTPPCGCRCTAGTLSLLPACSTLRAHPPCCHSLARGRGACAAPARDRTQSATTGSAGPEGPPLGLLTLETPCFFALALSGPCPLHSRPRDLGPSCGLGGKSARRALFLVLQPYFYKERQALPECMRACPSRPPQ